MSCCGFKAAATTPQKLHHLWVSDELLTDAFNRFLRVSRAHRRYGSNVPGPLEARRRLAKRRMGGAAVASALAQPSHDLGGLLGLAARPPPAFEKEWRWQAPMPGPPPAKPEQADVWSWPLKQIHGRPDEKVDEERVASFLETPQDPVETSKNAFEALLDAQSSRTLLEQDAVEPIIDFLQSSMNEPEARLTLRLIEWLGQRHTTDEGLRDLAAMISQKITLRTISEAEESLAIIQLLQGNDRAKTIVSHLIDALPRSWIQTVLKRTTSAILAVSDNRQTLVETWLECLRRVAFLKQPSHNDSEAWKALYASISQGYKPSELVEHFRTLDSLDFAMIVLRHWVPRLVNKERGRVLEHHDKSAIPSGSIDLDALSAELEELRELKHQYLSQNNASVDLISILVRQKLPYFTVLEELFAFWQKTESPVGVKDLVRQLRQFNPPIDVPIPLATSLVQSFIQSGELGLAFHVFKLLPNIPLNTCRELPFRLIEQGQMNSNNIWKIIDRWAEQESPAVVEGQPLKQELADLVHEAAYAWAKSPHLPARIAYRRVWECYRFLQYRRLPLSPLLTRALVRAGVVNFVREHMPVPKTRVQYTLDLVESVEGKDVRKEVDRMIFEYWMTNRNTARYKPVGQKAREKFLGEQVLEGGAVRRVKWDSRVLREAENMRRVSRQRGLHWPSTVLEPEATENDYGTILGPRAGTDMIDGSDMVGIPSEMADTAASEAIDAKALSGMAPDLLRTADGIDSAHEVAELTKIASERRNALEPEPDTVDWLSIEELSGNLDAKDSGQYRIHKPAVVEPTATIMSTGEAHEQSPVDPTSSVESPERQLGTVRVDLSSWTREPVVNEEFASTPSADVPHQAEISEPAKAPLRRSNSEQVQLSMGAEIRALRYRIWDLTKKNRDLRLASTPPLSRPNALESWVDSSALDFIPPPLSLSSPITTIRKHTVKDPGYDSGDEKSVLYRTLKQDGDAGESASKTIATDENESSNPLDSAKVEPITARSSTAALSKNSAVDQEWRSEQKVETTYKPPKEVGNADQVSSKILLGRARHSWRSPKDDQSVILRLRPARHAWRSSNQEQVEMKRLRPAWQNFEQRWTVNRERTGHEPPYEAGTYH